MLSELVAAFEVRELVYPLVGAQSYRVIPHPCHPALARSAARSALETFLRDLLPQHAVHAQLDAFRLSKANIAVVRSRAGTDDANAVAIL
jgi:hypothetical protein